MRYFFADIAFVAAFVLLYFWRCGSPQVAAQQTEVVGRSRQERDLVHQWRSGDTLWYEIDSIPYLPSVSPLADSMLRWHIGAPNIHDRDISSSPLHEEYAPIKLDYNIPYWSVYRRSITFWGITFSTGQPDPYVPYPEASQSADVLSMPIPKK